MSGLFEKIEHRIAKDIENRKKYFEMLDGTDYQVAVIESANVVCVSDREFIGYFDLSNVMPNGKVGRHYQTVSSSHKRVEDALCSVRKNFGKIFTDFNSTNGDVLSKVGCTVIVEEDSTGRIVDIVEPKRFFASHKFNERE